MLLLRIYLAQFIEAYEKLKGPRTFRLLFSHDSLSDGYRILTNTGAAIDIYCKEIVYQISYRNWWVRNRRIVMYHIYCRCSNDIDPFLKEKLSQDMVLTQLLHPLSNRTSHKKSVIEAYVDLIIAECLSTQQAA